MTPWADTCYRHDSNLLVGSSRIRSRRGVQQGGPLAPSPFSLAVHPCVVEAIRVSEAQYPGELDYKAFFLDDGTIAGKAHASSRLGLNRSQQDEGDSCLLCRAKIHTSQFRGLVISSLWGLLQVPRNGAKLFLIGESPKLVHCSRPSDDTSILRGPSSSFALAWDGPKSYTRVGPCTRRAKLLASATLTVTTAIPLVSSLEARCRKRTGGWPALALLPVVSEPVAQWNTHRPLMFPICPSPKRSVHVSGPGFDEYDKDGGLQRADTESSLLSSFLPNANIYGSSNAPSQKSLAKIEAKACQHLLDRSSRERHRLAHFGRNRVPGASAWLFALLDSLNLTSLPRSFESAFVVASVCPSGPGTVTAHFVDRSWTDGETTHWPVGAAGIGSLVITLFETSSIRPLMTEPTGETGPSDRPRTPLTMIAPDRDPPDPAEASLRPADVWVPRGPSGGQEAWDFSITSAFKLGPALPDPTSTAGIFTSVESRKNAFVGTASQCTKAGITFCPFILEAAVGGPTLFVRLSRGSRVRVDGLVPSMALTPA